MAKKSKAAAKERYEYVRAVVDCGQLTWEYKLEGKPASGMRHDEDVSDWSAKDIEKLTRDMLEVETNEKVEVQYV